MRSRVYPVFISALLFLSACATRGRYMDDTYNSARSMYSRQQFDEARMYYKKFVTENPGNALEDVALYYWGDSARQAGRFKEAEEVFNRLIEKYKTGFWADLAKKDLGEMSSLQK